MRTRTISKKGNTISRQAGFTIVETMVALSILLTIVAATGLATGDIQQGNRHSRLQRQAGIITAHIQRQLMALGSADCSSGGVLQDRNPVGGLGSLGCFGTDSNHPTAGCTPEHGTPGDPNLTLVLEGQTQATGDRVFRVRPDGTVAYESDVFRVVWNVICRYPTDKSKTVRIIVGWEDSDGGFEDSILNPANPGANPGQDRSVVRTFHKTSGL